MQQLPLEKITCDYKYIYQNGQLVAQEFVGEKKNFMLNDHKGTVQVVTNESGAKVEETFYSPFGEIISGGTTSRFDYEGKEYDSVVGDYDYHARKVNPQWGMFTQPDTMLPNVYDPQQLNRYAFERNNPYKYRDEDGNFVILPFLVAGAIVGTINTIDYYMTHDNTNIKGATGYFAAGFVEGALALTGIGGAFVGGGLSKAIENKIDHKDITSGVFGEGIMSAISFKLGEYLLPSTKEWLIKKPLSYLTTKTGLTFSTNIAAEEIASRSGAYLGETLRILRQNWNIGNANQANIYYNPGNSNSGSSGNNDGGGGSSSGSWYSYDRHIDADAGTTSYTAIRGDNNGYTWSTVTISDD